MKNAQKFAVRGIVTRRLYDKDGNPKRMFRENKFWELLRSVFNLDVKIPFITGFWTTDPVVHNDVTPAGLSAVAGMLIGNAVDPFKYLALGTGTATNSGLQIEITSSGGARAEGTTSLETIDETNDTAQVVYEWTFTGDLTITEEGLFNGASEGSPGTVLAFRNFSAIGVEDGNKLEITHQVQAKVEEE